jgi:hypothetical protein
MITVIFSTREDKPEHIEHIKKTSGIHKGLEVIQYINNGEYSLTELYNKGLDESENNIVIFCHDDIIFDTKNWGKKLLKVIEKNPEYGIVGIAGSRELPSSGKWWENPLHMYGQVFHQKDNNRWLSKYSPKKPLFLDNVVIVDGLFFVVKKDQIKERFDESVKGFHFYDVDFSFRNYIAGVKVGVTSDIDVTHLSIGETNEQWEKNREEFVKKYEDKLPVKAKKEFNSKNKLKVLIGCLNFQGLTGSEISTMELAKELVKNGCDVTVVSQLGPKFVSIAKRYGIKTYPIQEPPGFKLGDGKWGLNTPQGVVPSKPNQLYKTSDVKFDVIHTNHKPITESLLRLYPNHNFVNIVRSEVIDLENPVIDDRIKKYIAIRPTIKEYIKDNYDIDDEKINVIYNLFDKSKFKPKKINKNTDKKVTLFVGTMDYLRKEPIMDLIENVEELWLVGKDSGNYAKKLSEEHENVKYFPPTDNVETFVNQCDETAGILLGRSTIEGYLCNKPGWIYYVDKYGYMSGKEYTEVPKDLSIFDNDYIIEQILETYIESTNEI